MNLYELAGLAAVVLTVVAYVPYIAAIRTGELRPHFFSWLIWSITTAVVFVAQVVEDGGAGAWPTGVSAAITLYVAWLCWTLHGDISITRSDRVFLAAALASLPAWFVTADPFWAVVILTGVDVLGFGPTLRKAYVLPYEEGLTFYLIFIVRSALAIVALENLTATTVLFPLAMILACGLVSALLWRRRRVLASRKPAA